MAGAANEFPISSAKFGLALSWDAGAVKTDLDVQGIAFDMQGKLLDAVYYNNLKALGGGMTHSGDETSGAKAGHDESIWVHFSRLPASVKMIAFVVSCYSGGHLKDCKNGKFHIIEGTPNKEIGQFKLEDSNEEVDLVAGLIRNNTGSGWTLRIVHEPAQDGQHFVDILEPTIGNFVRQVIPSAPKRIKAAFAMEKGTVVDLPKTSACPEVSGALGWDTDQGSVDLDVSAVLMDQAGALVDACFFGKQQALGVTHSGDNVTGAGSGDDEVITFALDKIPQHVQQVMIVINIYTPMKSFRNVAKPYCRLLVGGTDEFCKYELSEAGDKNALIMARLFREPGGARWGFQALGEPCNGKTYKDSLPSMFELAKMSPISQQPKAGLETFETMPARAQAAPPPAQVHPSLQPQMAQQQTLPVVQPPAKETSCFAKCTVM